LRDERQPDYNEEVLAQTVKLGTRGVVNMGPGGGDADDLYDEVVEFVIQSGKASSSLLQRRFKVGYARAARLIDLLEENGVVGPADGAKPRQVMAAPTDMGGMDEASMGEDQDPHE
jgi:S-DNA-T family DNA segregation ATPase FtsK/SpoIIIE